MPDERASSSVKEMKKAAPTRRILLKGICYGALAASMLWALFQTYRSPVHVNDDILITLTYAKNLAAGNGFVFNQPPASLGTTSPLSALLFAAIKAMVPSIDLIRLAIWVSGLAWCGCMAAVFVFRKAFGLDLWHSAILAVAMTCVNAPYLGGEMAPFQCVLLLTIGLYFCGLYALAGVGCALLFLVRGEGALLFPLLFAYRAFVSVRSGVMPRGPELRALLKELAAMSAGLGVVLGVWSVYAYVTFGAVLPETLKIKMIQHKIGWPGALPYTATVVHVFRDIILGHSWQAYGVPAFAAAGAFLAFRKSPAFVIYAAWSMGQMLGYTILGVTGYWWYLYHVLFFSCALLALGTAFFVERIGAWSRRPIAAAIAVPLLFALALAPTWKNMRDRSVHWLEKGGDRRSYPYMQIAEWLNRHAQPTDSIAAGEIGYLGYYSNNRVIDLAGLVSPEVTKMLVAMHEAHMTDVYGRHEAAVFRKFQPDYFMRIYGSKPDAIPPPPATIRLGEVKYDFVPGQLYHAPPWVPGGELHVADLYRRSPRQE
ncbi:MAG TPA: hypothetical protein PKZ01_03130 [Candidatus Hydrogenedentes bacterium]|nr:hypothetical protein [Candidatus Hydrogenedentota bacterium]